MDRRTELIRGIIIEKVSKSPQHRTIGLILYNLILPMVPPGYSVWKDEPLTFRDSEPEPDLSVTRGNMSDYTTAHPTTAELVIEVALSSVALDRENASLYAEAGVKEYWIILGAERTIEVYRVPKNGAYAEKRVHGSDETLRCSSLPRISVRISDLFP